MEGSSHEDSIFFKGAYRLRKSCLPLREISPCLLNFEGCGTRDLGEIYQFCTWKRFACDVRQKSINSAPGNALPSTSGSTLVQIPPRITSHGRPVCAHVLSLSLPNFDSLHSLPLVRRWLQVRTPMQTLRFELSPLHFCSPPLTETPPTAEPL